MSKFLSIGRFSKLTGLSISALRFYDTCGLLTPAMIDPETGYRYYSFLQMSEAERIKIFRELEVPIEEIAGLMFETDPESIQSYLEQHRKRLEQQIAGLTQKLSILDSLTSEQFVVGFEVAVREETETHTLSLRYKTSLERTEMDRLQAIEYLLQHIKNHNGEIQGAPYLWYPRKNAFHPDEYEVEIAIPIASPIGVSEALKIEVCQAAKVAFTKHHGTYQHLHRAYRAVELWMRENQLCKTGFLRESYLIGPWQVNEANQYLTEIIYPVNMVTH